MLQSNFGRRILGAAVTGIAAVAFFAGCQGRGNTDGGSARPDFGTQFVSDGGAGATLVITAPDTLPVAGRREFFVTALDPQGLPLSFIRIFCESEHGIAILEPSRGGVAFEHTGAAGIMSGVLGGVTPGSYILECRAPHGFNLVDRVSIRVTGDVPEGFTGFPGAAGGNLGGGLLVDPVDEDVRVAEIRFVGTNTTPTRNANIDIVQGTCPPMDTPEPFFFDDYILTLVNGLRQRIFVETITFTVHDGRDVVSTQQFGNLLVGPMSEVDILGSFTDVIFNTTTKIWPGTEFLVLPGQYNVTFRVTGRTGSGSRFSATGSAAIRAGNINNC